MHSSWKGHVCLSFASLFGPVCDGALFLLPSVSAVLAATFAVVWFGWWRGTGLSIWMAAYVCSFYFRGEGDPWASSEVAVAATAATKLTTDSSDSPQFRLTRLGGAEREDRHGVQPVSRPGKPQPSDSLSVCLWLDAGPRNLPARRLAGRCRRKAAWALPRHRRA